jgi:iron complex transport system substrate-binding protein
VETVASARPDVVLLKSYLAGKLGKSLESLGIRVLYLDMETADRFAQDVYTLGQLFQNAKRAEYIIGFFRQRTERIEKALTGLSEDRRPRVLVLSYNDRDGQTSFRIPPPSWIQTQLVQMAGGRPIWTGAQLGGGWTKVTLEQIATWDADQIFLIAYGQDSGEVVRSIQANPQWQELRAVKERKLFAFPADFISWDQPDPRWILGLSWLAVKLHPGLYPGWDMEKEAQSFFHVLYGLDNHRFQSEIKPLLKGDFH